MRRLCLLAIAFLGVSGADARSIATGPFYLAYENGALVPSSDHAFEVVDDVIGTVPVSRILTCALDATQPNASQRLELVHRRLAAILAGRAELDVKAQCPEAVVNAAPASVARTSVFLWIELPASEEREDDA
ncbi:hypothetical protein [Citromicrobium bathyomarinum]|uniref:hypothetical protein n=1 Tax=Citromicrobium bathyomarinum TaxID=72174 RepID=UPI00315A386E